MSIKKIGQRGPVNQSELGNADTLRPATSDKPAPAKRTATSNGPGVTGNAGQQAPAPGGGTLPTKVGATGIGQLALAAPTKESLTRLLGQPDIDPDVVMTHLMNDPEYAVAMNKPNVTGEPLREHHLEVVKRCERLLAATPKLKEILGQRGLLELRLTIFHHDGGKGEAIEVDGHGRNQKKYNEAFARSRVADYGFASDVIDRVAYTMTNSATSGIYGFRKTLDKEGYLANVNKAPDGMTHEQSLLSRFALFLSDASFYPHVRAASFTLEENGRIRVYAGDPLSQIAPVLAEAYPELPVADLFEPPNAEADDYLRPEAMDYRWDVRGKPGQAHLLPKAQTMEGGDADMLANAFESFKQNNRIAVDIRGLQPGARAAMFAQVAQSLAAAGTPADETLVVVACESAAEARAAKHELDQLPAGNMLVAPLELFDPAKGDRRIPKFELTRLTFGETREGLARELGALATARVESEHQSEARYQRFVAEMTALPDRVLTQLESFKAGDAGALGLARNKALQTTAQFEIGALSEIKRRDGSDYVTHPLRLVAVLQSLLGNTKSTHQRSAYAMIHDHLEELQQRDASGMAALDANLPMLKQAGLSAFTLAEPPFDYKAQAKALQVDAKYLEVVTYTEHVLLGQAGREDNAWIDVAVADKIVNMFDFAWKLDDPKVSDAAKAQFLAKQLPRYNYVLERLGDQASFPLREAFGMAQRYIEDLAKNTYGVTDEQVEASTKAFAAVVAHRDEIRTSVVEYRDRILA